MRRKTSINLTPLVDITLILIFWFIFTSSKQVQQIKTQAGEEINQYQAQIEEAQQKLSKLSIDLENLQNHNKALTSDMETILDQITMKKELIIINLKNSDDSIRQVSMNKYNEEVLDIVLKWDNQNSVRNMLLEKLNEIISVIKQEDKEKVVLVLFLYDSSEVYNTDFKMINTLLEDIKNKNKTVYVIQNDIS